MGETDNAVKDAKQTSNSAAPSIPQAGTTSTPKTFTEQDVNKAVSDALAKAGRTAKTLEGREKAVKDAESRIAEANRLKEDAELDSAVGEITDEDTKNKTRTSLKSYKDRLRTDRQTFDELKTKHQPMLDALERLGISSPEELEETITSSKSTKFEMTVFSIAEKAGVSADVLKDKAVEFKITDEEGIQRLAELMPKKAEPHKPDSGNGLGGVDTSNMSSRELISHGLKNNK